MPMVIVTYMMGVARSVANEIIFIDDGKIMYQATPQTLFNNPDHKRTRQYICKFDELYGKMESVS